MHQPLTWIIPATALSRDTDATDNDARKLPIQLDSPDLTSSFATRLRYYGELERNAAGETTDHPPRKPPPGSLFPDPLARTRGFGTLKHFFFSSAADVIPRTNGACSRRTLGSRRRPNCPDTNPTFYIRRVTARKFERGERGRIHKPSAPVPTVMPSSSLHPRGWLACPYGVDYPEPRLLS